MTDRERKIANRVRRKLHLSDSMSEAEIAQELKGSLAWRRARMSLAREQIKDALAGTAGSLWASVKAQTHALWRRLWGA